jgi:hypothetical protein
VLAKVSMRRVGTEESSRTQPIARELRDTPSAGGEQRA